MKKLIPAILLFGFFATGNSQILLKETKVEYKAPSMQLDPVSNQLVLMIPETKFREFETNPLGFVKSQFEIQKTIRDNQHGGYDTYRVDFKSTHGHLVANFNEKGDLVSSFQKFKNLRLPDAVRLQILQEYRDANVIGSTYTASSKGWDLKKELYKIKIRDGDKTRRIKIHKNQNGSLSLAGY